MSIRQLSGSFDFPIHLGIAVGKSPIYTVDFNANVLSAFTPHRHRCWVVFGSYSVGETIDLEALTNIQIVDFSQTSPSQRVVADTGEHSAAGSSAERRSAFRLNPGSELGPFNPPKE
ncbi:hypothetical protein ACOJBM_00775 [Rhizobium beringeri]